MMGHIRNIMMIGMLRHPFFFKGPLTKQVLSELHVSEKN